MLERKVMALTDLWSFAYVLVVKEDGAVWTEAFAGYVVHMTATVQLQRYKQYVRVSQSAADARCGDVTQVQPVILPSVNVPVLSVQMTLTLPATVEAPLSAPATKQDCISSQVYPEFQRLATFAPTLDALTIVENPVSHTHQICITRFHQLNGGLLCRRTKARQIVTTSGSPSGMADTATLTDSMSI